MSAFCRARGPAARVARCEGALWPHEEDGTVIAVTHQDTNRRAGGHAPRQTEACDPDSSPHLPNGGSGSSFTTGPPASSGSASTSGAAAGPAIQFTPRRKDSVWSSVNLVRTQELTRLGLMRPAGLVAHEARTPARSGLYSYEQRKSATLPEAMKARLRRNRKAWAFFKKQPARYRGGAVWWIVSAKKPETRDRRLTALIEDSVAERTIKPITRPVRRRAAPPATPDRRPRRPPPRRPPT